MPMDPVLVEFGEAIAARDAYVPDRAKYHLRQRIPRTAHSVPPEVITDADPLNAGYVLTGKGVNGESVNHA